MGAEIGAWELFKGKETLCVCVHACVSVRVCVKPMRLGIPRPNSEHLASS